MTGRRLLIVDDEVDFGKFVRRVATEMGYEVEVTSNERDFKETYRRFDPTDIVLDIVMPAADGIDLARWLVAMKCKARIVIISGFDPSFAKAAELVAHIGDLTSTLRLSKPVSVAQLKHALS